MKRKYDAIGRRHEHGAIAVEMALVLPILILFLALPSLFLAFYFRQFSAAQKAMHDAAIYLSTAPSVEVTTPGPDGYYFAAVAVAKKIVEKEMAGIVPDGIVVGPTVNCVYLVNGGKTGIDCTPANSKAANRTLFQLNVSVSFNYINPLTNTETQLSIFTYAPVRYVGN